MKQAQIQIHELGKLNNFCLKKKKIKMEKSTLVAIECSLRCL